MLLTDDEIRRLHGFADGTAGAKVMGKLVKDAEAAILAKLGAMELPEPAYFVDACELDRAEKCCLGIIHCTRLKGVFTADQLQQAYAQGAAAQLSSEPSGFTTPEFCSIFLSESCAKEHGEPIPLYTRREAK
jgi:hypothetical protein